MYYIRFIILCILIPIHSVYESETFIVYTVYIILCILYSVYCIILCLLCCVYYTVYTNTVYTILCIKNTNFHHFEVFTNMHLFVSLQCMTAFESGTKIFNYTSYTISYPVWNTLHTKFQLPWLCWSKADYLRLSQAISGYLGLSRTTSRYLGLSRAILGYLWLSLAMSSYLRLSTDITDYLGLSRAISGYIWLSWVISDYLGLSRATSGYLKLSSFNFMKFILFWKLFG